MTCQRLNGLISDNEQQIDAKQTQIFDFMNNASGPDTKWSDYKFLWHNMRMLLITQREYLESLEGMPKRCGTDPDDTKWQLEDIAKRLEVVETTLAKLK